MRILSLARSRSSVPVPLYRRYRYRYRTPVPVLDLALALVEVLVQGKLYVKVFPEVGKAGKVGSTASTVFYMPDAVRRTEQLAIHGSTTKLQKVWRLCQTSKKSGVCAKPGFCLGNVCSSRKGEEGEEGKGEEGEMKI